MCAVQRVEYDKGVLENRRALREQNRIASAIARKDHYQVARRPRESSVFDRSTVEGWAWPHV